MFVTLPALLRHKVCFGRQSQGGERTRHIKALGERALQERYADLGATPWPASPSEIDPNDPIADLNSQEYSLAAGMVSRSCYGGHHV